MCSGGDSNAQQEEEQRRLIEQQNNQNQSNFLVSQDLAEQQFDFQRDQANQAAANERDRTNRINSATRQINSVFDGRSGIYDQVEDATFDINRDRLRESRDSSITGLKHGLARSGLTGSSVDVDRNEDIQERFNTGLLDARNTAQTSANQVRSADSGIQSSLISAASTGNFSGSDLLRSAGGALSSTANTAPVIIPQFANDTFFSDIVGGLGNIAFQAGNAVQQFSNRNNNPNSGSTSGTVRGG